MVSCRRPASDAKPQRRRRPSAAWLCVAAAATQSSRGAFALVAGPHQHVRVVRQRQRVILCAATTVPNDSQKEEAEVRDAPKNPEGGGGGGGEISTASTDTANTFLSRLARSLKPSKTIEIHALTTRLREQGEDVISLSVGEPDFAPPTEILDAVGRAATAHLTRYTDVVGTLALRRAIAADLSKRKGTTYDPVSQIVVSNGAKQAVYEAILALCGPGDEVVVPAPYWVSYPEMVEMAGASPVVVETRLADGYRLAPEMLRQALTERTKLVILCNPCNPTGACLGVDDLRALHDVLREWEDGGKGGASNNDKVWVLADEIYERLYYGAGDGRDDDDDSDAKKKAARGKSAPSFAALDRDAWERTVVVNGFSKAFAMTGFRLGYLAAPTPVAKAAAKIQGQITSCASSLSQAAGVAALALPDDALDAEVAEFEWRRDYVLDRLRTVEATTRGTRITCPPAPDGAFYVLPEIRACFGLDARLADGRTVRVADSTAFCAALLEARNLALVPGDAFGAPNGIRISYAASRTDLARAMDALELFLTVDLVDPPLQSSEPAVSS